MEGPVARIDLGFVNAYLLEAREGFVLVDTGLAGQGAKLEAALEAEGCLPGRLKLIVITHADRDHTGNAAAIAAKWGAPIAVHELDKVALEGGAAPARRGRTRFIDFAIRLAARRRKGAAGSGSGAATGAVTGVPKAEVLLADGQSLETWGLAATALHVPGHTPGSIGLLLEDGVLIAGDFFSNRRKPGLSPFVWDFDAYAASLERLIALGDRITAVHPGHGAVFEGGAIRVMRAGRSRPA